MQITLDERGIDLAVFGIRSDTQELKLKKLIFSMQLYKRNEVRQGFK